MVINKSGTAIDFKAAVVLMDDDPRFFTAYEEAHEHKYCEQWELSRANPVW